MIVVVAPGQGSQTPGFLAPWIEDPAARTRLEQLGEAAGVDLVTHGTESDAETIKDTQVAQPLIVAAGILALDALLGAPGRREAVGGIAGHSVGEITAAVGAGVLEPLDAMALVGERGRAMAEAASQVATGMAAVIGGDADALEARLGETGLAPANYNGGGQIVVAGTVEGIEALRAEPPAGARVIPLQTAGAFHTSYMAPAVERLRAKAADTAAAVPTLRLWTNADGTEVVDGRTYLDLIVGQVANPVRWDACMDAFLAAGVTGVIELAPAGALVGLAKRGMKGVPTVAVKTPDDLAAAIELLETP
ncbi:ACP S-malonyltransferase [Agrococcus sp. SGAir0287]|uniref:ACP S-malonyltransferase n=1 Tax=Agrococcus sp. SGAir0287 TaxID=2070347 RepID=UPI0010CD2012|nr:ACP S-malonyltransferase [Agrococcus sp. SGAir0287]QCR19412.1 ACP S-malonyltransferase [Agrococcus sp. SGAir0287]